jgi:hypothetical protein
MALLGTMFVAVGIPLVLLFINLFLRQSRSLCPSAAADTLITLAIFQGVVIVEPTHFRSLIVNPDIQISIVSVFAFLLGLTILSWFCLLLIAEPQIESYNRRLLFETLCKVSNCSVKSRFQSLPYPLVAKFLALFLPLSLAGGTLSAFLYGG